MENIGIAEQRVADAHRAESAADLDRIKILKELESIDLSHLRELVEMNTILRKQFESDNEGLKVQKQQAQQAMQQTGEPNAMPQV